MDKAVKVLHLVAFTKPHLLHKVTILLFDYVNHIKTDVLAIVHPLASYCNH